jgi:predicted O-methyltransferase YrrM
MVPLRQERGVQCICVLEIEKPMAHLQGDFHGISDFLLKRTRLLQPQAEYTPGREDYTMFNTGGVELEVGEFLYAFVKMVKPKRILETGTHLGISAMYMAQALKENKGGGKVITLEIFDENIQKSKALWRDTQVEGLIEVHKRSSLEFETSEMFDMLFLDSEPDIRFDELNRFYSKLKPGGFIVIHDLHVNLGLSNLFINGMHNWPFGDFREKFGGLLKDFSLQTFTFRTPRGLVMFQKADKDFSHTAYMRASKAEEMPQ